MNDSASVRFVILKYRQRQQVIGNKNEYLQRYIEYFFITTLSNKKIISIFVKK